MGVASFFPIHKFDNALGGVRFDSGTFGAAINAANFKQTGHFWEIEPCGGAGEDNPQDTALPDTDVIDAGLLSFFPKGIVPLYPPPPHCNALGLTPLGEFTVEQMIDRGLMVEVDHMSLKSATRAVELAEARNYSGVLSSHSWMDPHLRARVYGLGGFIEPITTSPESFIEEWRQLRAVADISKVVEVPERTVLTRQGEPGEEFFIIVDGTALVTLSMHKKHRLKPGEFFGEMSLLDGGPRSATVKAETDLRVLVINRAHFWELISAVPELTQQMLVGLSRRLRAIENTMNA